MNLLGLDIGSKRIGVAYGETKMGLAVPLRVVPRTRLPQEAQEIARLAVEHGVEKMIVGMPLSLNGEEGPQAAVVRRYWDKLAPLLALPFEFADERFSTVEAMELQSRAGRTQRQGRATVDASAAAVMLQAFLDSHPS